MKLKFINYRRLGADYDDPAFVPHELIRKHWSLRVIEFGGFCLGLILILTGIFRQPDPGLSNDLIKLLIIIGGISFWAGSFLCALDMYQYRVSISSSHVLLASFIILASGLNMTIFFSLPSILAILFINFHAKNIDYYQWCKSIAK